MSIVVQHRRGTRTEADANTPVAGEFWWDTSLNTIRAGTGALLGGWLFKQWGRDYKIAPSQIAGDVNNYSPSDLAIAEHINLTSDAARTITGLAFGAINRTLTIRNKGSFNITLAHANAGSLAANRFEFGGDDVVLRPGDAIKLHYDDTSSRWGRAGAGGKIFKVPEDFAFAGTISPSQITSTQNNYAPTGITTATVIRLSSDASRSVTGLVDPRGGEIKLIVNVGTNNIILENADGGSTAANQFDFGADVTLAAKQAAFIIYDATDSRWKLLGSTAGAAVADGAVLARTLAGSALRGQSGMVNGTLTESRAGNAATFSIKTLAGTDPTASDPVLFVFQNGSGGYVVRIVNAALSITASSGSSLGASNNVPFRVRVIAADDAGTVRPAIVNTVTQGNIMGLPTNYPLSSTAEGGAGAADSAQVLYSGTAFTSKYICHVGYCDYDSGLATVGTWNAAPTRIVLQTPDMALPGASTSNRARAELGSVATGTTQAPNDDTIPQNTEGDQYLSQGITPTAPQNVLRIRTQLHLSSSVNGGVIMSIALFQDSVASALRGSLKYELSGGYVNILPLEHSMVAGTTSAMTFKMRAGTSIAGTTTFNGSSGGRLLGSVLNSFLDIEELMA